MGATKTDITLYTANTPNGIKVSILLEELNLDYKVHPIDMSQNVQKEPWFLAVNPNGRIPAITDRWADGRTLRVFESGAVLQYLAERYDAHHRVSYPRGTPEYWEMTSWMGGLGPMQGQVNHFKRYAPEKIQYGIDRYTNETRRLYRTMDEAIGSNAHGVLVGDRVTIADISAWGWVAAHHWAGIDLHEFPNLAAWLHRLLKRPGFEAGRHVPTRHTALDHENLADEELDSKAKETRGWVQAGMKADAKKL